MDEPRTAKPTRRKPRVAYPIIIAVIIGVGALLVVQSSFSSGTYSLEISDIQERPGKYVGRDVKIVGVIKEGSVKTETTAEQVVLTFAITDGQGQDLLIRYPHNPPDPFKEGRQCIVEGTYAEDGAVDCHKLTVKCPSKYQEEGLEGGDTSDEYYQKKYGTPAGGPTS